MNEEFINNIKEIKDKTIEPYKNIQNNIDSLGITKLSEKLKEISQPMLEISKLWIEYELNAIKPINSILKNFDFSKIDEQTKKACEIMLSNGFYPYNRLGISICYITKLKNSDEIVKEICSYVEDGIKINKKRFFNIFKNYKKIITEIYELYHSEKYRLCILSQINFVSQVFNYNFEYKDFTESKEDILREFSIITNSNDRYYQFIPYIIDEEDKNKKRKYKNTILANYKAKPEKYEDIPYNRNAIIHGYSKDFGNKENCLRWFSVMLNTLDLFELYEKIFNEVR